MATGRVTSGRASGLLAAWRRGGDVGGWLTRHSDLALAGLVIAIVAMMIVPLPTPLLDLLISLNLAGAVTLLLVSIYVSDALKIATFPTLLLLTTLFRLGLEVSATRLILLRADAGEVIHAFGSFVVAGNLVVGAVVFVILTIIQFIVISKGSERVAEVAARFALDALPGRQMAIDGELRAGHIDRAEAQRRRAALARESQLYGAMDGAMKFVKGDAVAGLVVLAVNILGGLVIGVMQRGLDLAAAARTYTLLTIGEGLVAQIPALIISTAAGIIVTRVASEEDGDGPGASAGTHLGQEIAGQVLGQPKAIAVAAALLGGLALVPGLPLVPFLLLAAVLGFVARGLLVRQRKARRIAGAASPASASGGGGATGRGAAPASWSSVRASPGDPSVPLITPIEIELGPRLAGALVRGADGASDDDDDDHERHDARQTACAERLSRAVRDQLFAELGIPLPPLRVRSKGRSASQRGDDREPQDDHEDDHGNQDGYVIRVNEVPLGRGEIPPGHVFVRASATVRAAAGLDGGIAAADPDGGTGAFVPATDAARARAAGWPVLDAEAFLAAHASAVLRRYGHELIGIEETQTLLSRLERSHPALVREVVPKIVSAALLADVLRRLVEEGVSLRNLKDILDALAERAPAERDPVALTEHVRAALRRAITHRHADDAGVVSVLALDPMIEDAVREAIHRTATGSALALEPQLSREIVDAVGRAVAASSSSSSRRPVILASADIRRYVRRLIESAHPELAVLSHPELAPEAAIQAVGHIAAG